MIPIEFLRHFRIGGYAIFDFTTAFLGIYLLALLSSKLFLKLRIDISKKSWLLLTLPIGIATHLIFGKITPMTRNFMDINGHYILKLIIIGLLILGINGIRIVKKNTR